ncbi:hypothetical protein P879_03205 [Paragonimus westermani]|uniref:DUF5735 domain-containing protein n=1 Tax=Paragonimus westermani TaxID=34504 RepID=A0A8T0DFR5_9TREM|nr:hypothetical protein P879_03205 [Paragonimus westermani]
MWDYFPVYILLLPIISFLKNAIGVIPDVYTQPKELGFKVHSEGASELYLVQPKLGGSIVAQLGPHTSNHVYNMSSITVYLNTHAVHIQKSYISPLLALCTVENKGLIAQQNGILLCVFHVHMPLFPHISANSSCLINCVNESDCVAQIDLDFIRSQYHLLTSAPITVIVDYNVTAYQVNSTEDPVRYVTRADITQSLIHQNQKLLPVIVSVQPDWIWHTLMKDPYDLPIIQVGLPSVREKLFSIQLNINKSSIIQELKLKLVLGSTLRYRYEKTIRSERSRPWRVKVISKRYGALIRVRRSVNETTKIGEFSKLEHTTGLDSDYVVIADLVLEEILQGDLAQPYTPTPWSGVEDQSSRDFDTDHIDSMDVLEPNEPLSDASRSNQPLIQIQVIHLVPGGSVPQNQVDQSSTLLLIATPLIPKPDARHIFVLFEPKDILEPPWDPAIPSPEPYKLRVLSLTPFPQVTTLGPFGARSAGHLTDITSEVYCRPSTLRASPIETGPSASSACPSAMPRAPPEVEDYVHFPNGSLLSTQSSVFSHAMEGLGDRLSWSDQLVLALRSSPVANRQWGTMPSTYGPVRSESSETIWAFDFFSNVSVNEDVPLRNQETSCPKIISSLHSTDDSMHHSTSLQQARSHRITDRYEQTPVTVTARIYTVRPGTGQRIYLSSTDHSNGPRDLPVDAYRSSIPSESEATEPMKFDVTRLLPPWALVVRPVLQNTRETSPLTAAYIHYDTFSGRPYLVGLRPGPVLLGLVATFGDSQPLVSTYVYVGTSQTMADRALEEEPLNIVGIRADCVDPNVRLSGHLSPATLASGAEGIGFERLHGPNQEIRRSDPFDSTPDVQRLKQVLDYSLPNPQRLTIKLHRVDSTSNGLITAAASSATRSAEFLRSILRQKVGATGAASGHPRPSASSVSCPLPLLSVSLIMSDGSVLPTHTVPPGQLRVSSFGSELVWDPSNNELVRRINLRIRINSLVVWSPRLRTPNEVARYSVPLGVMDDVIAAVQSGSSLPDPGLPLTVSKLITLTNIPQNSGTKQQHIRHQANQLSSDGVDGNQLLSALYLPTDRANVLIASQSPHSEVSARDQMDDHGDRSVTLVTHILVGIGCLAVVLFTINGIVLLAIRKRRQHRTTQPCRASMKKSMIGHVDAYNVVGNDGTAKQNGGLDFYPPGVSSDSFKPQYHAPPYSESLPSQALLHNSSTCPPDITQMAAGLSCSSMGSGVSGPVNSLKQSMLMEAATNPYLLASDSSLPGVFHSPQNSQLSNMPPYTVSQMLPINSQTRPQPNSSSWNSPSSLAHNRQFQCLNPTLANQSNVSIGWPPRLSPTTVGPCNTGYNSGLGSVGTAEGCSDEGVASGFEVISLSQETGHSNVNATGLLHPSSFGSQNPSRQPFCGIPQSATGGTNSTASGGSATGLAGPINRTLISTFKRSQTSGIGAGSLSGDSSAGEFSDIRQISRRPGSVSPMEQDGHICMNQFTAGSPDRHLGRRRTSPPPCPYTINTKVPAVSCLDTARDVHYPQARMNLMAESFTNATPSSRYADSVQQRTAQIIRNGFQHGSPNQGRPHSQERLESGNLEQNGNLEAGSARYKRDFTIPPPCLDRNHRDGNGRVVSDDLDLSLVPMPPMLLLNSQVCLDVLNPHNVNTLYNTTGMPVPPSPAELRTSLGSYKRSDSFGMATKQSALQTHEDSGPRHLNHQEILKGPPNSLSHASEEMVGDTLDMSDDVSSGSKCSSAFKKDANLFGPIKPMEFSRGLTITETSDLTYLHKLPPPEF